MGNVATVTGALLAGIVGGSLFAVGLVARPQTISQTPQPSGAAVAAPAPVVTGPGGPAVVVPALPKPGTALNMSGPAAEAEAGPKLRQSADGLVPLAHPRVE